MNTIHKELQPWGVVNGLSGSKSLISSVSFHLMNYVSHQRTWPRPGPTVHPHRVYTRSAKNYTQESGNGLSRSKQSISSLSAHSKSYVSNQQNWPRSWSKVHPHKIWMRSVKTYTWESCNGISRSKPLITLVSVHFTIYISHEQTRPSMNVIREELHPGGR